MTPPEIPKGNAVLSSSELVALIAGAIPKPTGDPVGIAFIHNFHPHEQWHVCLTGATWTAIVWDYDVHIINFRVHIAGAGYFLAGWNNTDGLPVAGNTYPNRVYYDTCSMFVSPWLEWFIPSGQKLWMFGQSGGNVSITTRKDLLKHKFE